jgi:hypothetical protein
LTVLFLDPLKNFFPVHSASSRSRDAQANLAALHIDHLNLDIIANGDCLAYFTGKNKHLKHLFAQKLPPEMFRWLEFIHNTLKMLSIQVVNLLKNNFNFSPLVLY